MAPTAVTGNIVLGKYTKCRVLAFPVREFTVALNDLPKHPQVITPRSTHTGYISSAFPANMTNKNQYTIANNAEASIENDPGGENLEWENNEIYGNGYDVQLESRGFDNQKPIAEFNIPASGVVGEEIAFTNNSYDPDGEIGHVLWDFDDSYPVSDFSPTHIYTKPGEYRVTLLIWDEPGRGARAEHFITIESLGTDESNPGIPTDYKLSQNYPNPFNPITTLRYDLPEQSMVNIIIYDLLGRQVRTLLNQTQDAGYRSVIWNATNDYGKPVSAGVYLYKIQAGEFVQTRKMVLLK